MPIAPFIYGVIVGSVVTYIAKDKPSQDMLKDTSGKAADGIAAISGKVTSIFKKSEEEAAEKAADKKDAVA